MQTRKKDKKKKCKKNKKKCKKKSSEEEDEDDDDDVMTTTKEPDDESTSRFERIPLFMLTDNKKATSCNYLFPKISIYFQLPKVYWQ